MRCICQTNIVRYITFHKKNSTPYNIYIIWCNTEQSRTQHANMCIYLSIILEVVLYAFFPPILLKMSTFLSSPLFPSWKSGKLLFRFF